MLTVQRKLHNFHYFGSYCKTDIFGVCTEKRRTCCYYTPTGIINELIRKQSCLEFRDTLRTVDWDNINLDEWTAVLKREGLDQGDKANLSVEALTGEGSALPGPVEGGERENLYERTEKRVDGVPFEDRKYEAMKALESDVQ